MIVCKYCNKECKNNNSHRNHERLCKYNPNRQSTPFMDGKQLGHEGSNQYTKAKNLGLDKPVISENTRKKLSDNRKASSNLYWSNSENRKKQSDHAKRRKLGGHTSKKKLYYERNDGTVVYLQSSYEIEFAKLLDELNIEWTRPEPLIWVDYKGDNHRYYPDFLVDNIYIDTKNDYLAIKDKFKIDSVIQQNNVDVRIVTKQLITKEYIIALKT